MSEVHQHLGILLPICHQGLTLFTIGMKLEIFQHLICGVIQKRWEFLVCADLNKKTRGFLSAILLISQIRLSAATKEDFIPRILTIFPLLQTRLEIEPRYPMFGGWRTSFTIGYGLPLKDFLFQSEGKRFLNISFGSPIRDLVIDNLIVKVSGSGCNFFFPLQVASWDGFCFCIQIWLRNKVTLMPTLV